MKSLGQKDTSTNYKVLDSTRKQTELDTDTQVVESCVEHCVGTQIYQ